MTGKGVVRSIKNYAKGFTDVQIKVREATSNDAWGPSGTLMNEIAQATYNQQDFIQVMDMIDRRLNDKGKNWRHVFKALLLLDYCVHVGSENVVLYAKENLYVVKTLKEFQHIDDNGRDVGSNVRQKAKDITSLLLDDARLKEERHKRTQMRDRMSAVGDYMNETILNGRHENGEQMYERPSYLDEDTELRKAIEESKRLAQEEAKKRNQGDEDLAKAIQLSEQEAREKEEKQRARLERENEQNLFNTNNNNGNNIQGFQGFPQNQAFSSSANPYTQQQQQFQQQQQQWPQNTGMTGLSFSDPITAQQPMFNQTTGFGNQFQQNNPYQQQQAFPQSLQAQMTGMPQQTQFTGMPSFQTNQLMAQQPQLTGLPSFQTSTMTGTNPFGQQQQNQSLIPQQTQQFSTLQPQQTGFVTTSTPTISTATTTNGFNQAGSSAFGNNSNNSNNNNNSINNTADSSTNQLTTSSPANSKPEDPRYAKLNSLLGNREDGMDTFGNTGNLRIPFGSGYASTIKPEANATGNNTTNTSNGNTANSSPSFSQTFSQQTSRNPFGAGNSSQSAPGTPVSNNKSLLEMMAEKNIQQQQQQQPFQQMQQPQMTGFNNSNNGFGQQLQPQMTGFQQPQVTGFNQNSPFQQSQPQQQSSAFGQQNSSFF